MATNLILTTVNKTGEAVVFDGYTTPTQSKTGEAEVFAAPIQAADGRGFFVIDNENGTCDITASLPAGDYVGAADTTPVTVAQGDTALIFADSAVCKTMDGMLCVKLTPASSASLSACGVRLAAVQLLPVVNH